MQAQVASLISFPLTIAVSAYRYVDRSFFDEVRRHSPSVLTSALSIFLVDIHDSNLDGSLSRSASHTQNKHDLATMDFLLVIVAVCGVWWMCYVV